MNHLFLLSQENLPIAHAECIALTGSTPHLNVNSPIILLDLPKQRVTDISKRAAYVKRIYRHLFTCNAQDLLKGFELYDWQKVYQKDFAVRIERFSKDSLGERVNRIGAKELAGIVWHSLDKPKVNLTSPSTHIEVIIHSATAYVGLLVHDLHQHFNDRKAHRRPCLHPSSLHPKLARAMVNLTGCTTKDTILDPCCGTGGILLEAGLIGCNVRGIDIDPRMVEMCKTNLKEYGISSKLIQEGDSTKCTLNSTYIVSDLPYGKNTKSDNLPKMYRNFMKNIDQASLKRAVLGFPDYVNTKHLIRGTSLTVSQEFTYYLHRSLSKRIVCLAHKKS